MTRVPMILAAMALTAAAAGPHKVVRETPALDFSYVWPAEAAAIPALDSRLYADAKAKLAQAQKDAREDQALTREQKRDFNQHYYATAWEKVGQTSRLLSLEATVETFTGGAHPNHDANALLWDRKLNRAIDMADLFARRGTFERLTRTGYCKTLDAERLKRREGEKLGGDFDVCPKYGELAITPIDDDNDGRFDKIDLIAAPYVAGPYAEGEYEVVLPVTSALVAGLKPEYRAFFKAQRQ